MMLLEKKLEQERILSGSTSVYVLRFTCVTGKYVPSMETKALDSINYDP